ncbi:MAG: hypothetical protein Q8Q62_17525 [Mesorhizobium sp.]|nr:hypothetical protein [Mesorhizobium sp.]
MGLVLFGLLAPGIVEPRFVSVSRGRRHVSKGLHDQRFRRRRLAASGLIG